MRIQLTITAAFDFIFTGEVTISVELITVYLLRMTSFVIRNVVLLSVALRQLPSVLTPGVASTIIPLTGRTPLSLLTPFELHFRK